MNQSVLFLEGQTIQTLPCLCSLKKKGYETHIFCKHISYAYYSRFVDKKRITVDCQFNPEQYKDDLIAYLKEYKIDLIIPMNDEVSPFASKYKKEINEFSNLLLPDLDIFLQGFDKNELMKVCKKIEAPHPATADLDKSSLDEAAEYVGFPSIIKPNYTSGGRGMKVVNSLQELRQLAPSIIEEFGKAHLQRFITTTGGRQFKVQIFTDNDTINISTVMEKTRFYPLNGGSSCCNITIENNELIAICTKVLAYIGWVGFADFDLIQDPVDGLYKIMEINPRIPACIRTSFVSGVDFAEIIADYTLTGKVKKYKYQPGKTLRYFGLDLLWLLKSKQSFFKKIAWFNLFGRGIYYQDASFIDPVPFFSGTLQNIKKMLNPEFKKAKQGLI